MCFTATIVKVDRKDQTKFYEDFEAKILMDKKIRLPTGWQNDT